MTLPADQRLRLEREHDFAQWRGDRGSEARPITEFAFRGNEIPGWRLVKSHRNPGLTPPRLETFWEPSVADDVLLGIRIVEAPSVAAARDSLLLLLGEVESAAIRRRPDLDLGEVAFGQEMLVMFARGNVIAVVRNAGRKVVTVLEVAALVDAALVKAAGAR